MKVFVAGATGYLGAAVAEAFRRRGHRVSGLARTEAKGRLLADRGIEPVLGDMKDPASYASAAAGADVLAHCAAEYTADYQLLDRRTVDAFLTAAARKRTILYTSGVWQYGPSGPGPVDETFQGKPLAPWRGEHEKLVVAAGGLVIRPGCVYGLSGGLTGEWFSGALDSGAAPVVGKGENRWATVHADDCGELFALAAESGLKGDIFNATDGSRSTVREMAAAASRAAGKDGKIAELDARESERRYGGMAAGLALDQNVDSTKARRLLGWRPRFDGFLNGAASFFASWMAARGA